MEGIALLFKVFWSPGEALFRAAKSPRTALVPILVLTLAGIVSALIMFSHVSMAEIAMRALEQSGRAEQMSPEQKERFLAVSSGPVPRAISTVSTVVGPTLLVTVVTVVYFGLFSLVGRDGPFKSYFAITAFAFAPWLIRNIAAAATVMVVPSSALMIDEIGSISPSILVDRTGLSKPVFTLINQIDIVSIWMLVLLVIGYKFVVPKRTGTATRAICVFGVWAVWVFFRVGLSSVF